VHLVCRNLHQIANLYVNPKLCFREYFPKNLKTLLESSRIFEELEFVKESLIFLLDPGKFELIEEYLDFTGPHIKKLIIEMRVYSVIFRKFLNLLPNLESLELNNVECRSGNERSVKWDLKLTKVERLRMTKCTGFENLLEFLEKCAIRELELNDCSPRDSEAIQKFVKSQEKNLKKLTIISESNFLRDLTDLRLDHLEFDYKGSGNISLEFLRPQADLKFLKLFTLGYSDADFNTICELKSLEVLDLRCYRLNSNGLSSIHKLTKLKRFLANAVVSTNVLDQLRFGVFQDLEELEGCFKDASVESVQEMKRIAPNLKKLVIHEASSDTLNALLETLENLEEIKFECEEWQLSEKVHPKIRQISCCFELNVEQFSKQFPNVESLELNIIWKSDSFIGDLLNGFKQLKTLQMNIRCDAELNPEPVLQCLQEYGGNLEEAQVDFRFPRLQAVPGFAIVKKSGGSFCINRRTGQGN
jgi:hypothetical protein